MILTGLLGIFCLLINKKTKSLININFMKSIIFGFFLPSLDFIVKILFIPFHSGYYNFEASILKYSIFHSIFTLIIILIIIKILSEYFSKKSFKNISKGLILGYSIYILFELILFPKNIYLFWPLHDYDLFLTFNTFFNIKIDFNIIYILMFFITLEFLFFLFFGKLLLEFMILGVASDKNFNMITYWIKTQKNLFLIFSGLTIILFFINPLNINLLLLIYILFYIPSIIKYLTIVFNIDSK